MTPEQLDEIRARHAAATPGPWDLDPDTDRGHWIVRDQTGGTIARLPDHGYTAAEFIADAREDVPALLAEVERLQSKRAAAREAMAAAMYARDRHAEYATALAHERDEANDDANRYADRVCNLEWLLQHHGIAFPTAEEVDQ